MRRCLFVSAQTVEYVKIFATVEEEYVLKGVFGMRPSEGTQMRKRLGLSEAVHLVGDSL